MGEPNADLRRARQVSSEKKSKRPDGGLRTLSPEEVKKYGTVDPEYGTKQGMEGSDESGIDVDAKNEQELTHSQGSDLDDPDMIPAEEPEDLKLVEPKEKNPLLDHPVVQQLQSVLSKVRTERMIPVDEIIRFEENPRSDFDPEYLKGLGSSLEGGQTETAKVRPLSTTEQKQHSGKKYKLISGEQRWRGAKAKGIPELRCIVFEGDMDPQLYYLMSVLENTARKDISFLDESVVCTKLRDEYDMTTKQIATLLSFNTTMSIDRRLAVNDVPEKVAEMLDPKKYPDRTLPIDAVYHLAPYKDDPAFQHAVAHEILETEIPATQCKSYIQRRAKAQGKESSRKERRSGGPSASRSFLRTLMKNTRGTVDTLFSRYSWTQMRSAFASSEEREQAADVVDELGDDLKRIAAQLRMK